MSIDLILLIIAALCFIFAAFGVQPGKVGLVPLGLFAWVLTSLI